MAKYLPLPDGSSLKVPDSMSYEDAMSKAQERFPDLFGVEKPKKETGFFAGLGQGFHTGLGSTATSLGELTGIEGLKKFGESQRQAAQATNFAPEQAGLLGEAGQTIGSLVGRYGAPIAAGAAAAAAVPEELAAAPIVAGGSAALDFLGLNTVGAAANAAGFAAANAPVNIGETLTAQKEAGQERSVPKALAVGIGKTAVDSLGGAILGGPMRGLFGKTAMQQAELLAPKVVAGEITAKEASEAVSGFLRNMLQAVPENAAVGAGTMVGHNVLERAGLGQDITSPEALESYGQDIKAGLTAAPLFAGLQARGARGEAQGVLDTAAQQRGEALRKEAEAKQGQVPSLDEANAIKQQYETNWSQYLKQKSELGKKPSADDPPHMAIEYEEKKAALDAQRKIVDDLAPAYHQANKLLKTQKPLLLGAPQAETPAVTGIEPRAEAAPSSVDLVDQYKAEQAKEAPLQQQMQEAATAGDTAKIRELAPAYQGLQVRLKNLKDKIEKAGGVLTTPEEFETQAAKELQAHGTKINNAKQKLANAAELGDFENLEKHADTLDALAKEREEILNKHAQTRQQLLKQETPVGQNFPLLEKEQAGPVKTEAPEPETEVDHRGSQYSLFSQPNVEATAERNMTSADKLARTPVGETVPMFSEREAPTIKEPAGPPKPQEFERLREKDLEENKPAPEPDTHSLDLFTPENFERTDERNLPDAEREKIVRDRLDQHLLDRLDLPGTEVTRVATPEQAQHVMDRIMMEKRKIEEPVGNQKISRVEEAKQLKEKYDALKAKYDAGERGHIVRSMTSTFNRYNDILNKYIEPAQAEIERLHKSLYKVKKVATPKVEKAAARERANEEARREMSAEATVAKRFNEGDIRAEAEKETRIRNTARLLGRYDPKYVEFVKKQQSLLKEGKTTADKVQKALVKKAEELGKKNPKYEAALEKHIERLTNAIKQTGEMQPKSLRTTQVTRTATNAPRELRGRTEKTAGGERYFGESAKDLYKKELDREIEEARKFDEGHATEYRAEERTPLSEANQDLLANKDITGVLRDLATTSKSPLIRESAARLEKLVGDTKIQIVSDLKLNGKSVPAYYDPKTNTIKFHPEGMSEEDLIHEAEHAATVKNLKAPNSELTKDQINARNEIFSIYSRLKNDGTLTGEYAAKDPEEFIAEVRSNQGLRDKLKGKNWVKGNMLERLWTAFKRFIGYGPKDALEAADKHIQALESESGKVAAKETPSIFRKKEIDYGAENDLTKLASKIIATEPKRTVDNLPLAAEMELVDMRAGIRTAVNKGAEAINKPDVATQVMSNVVRNDDKVQMAMTVLSKGPLELYKDEKGLYGVRSSGKNSAVDVMQAVSKVPLADKRAKDSVTSAYLMAIRAKNKGLSALDIGALGVKEEDLAAALKAAKADPALEAALEDVRVKYNAYNEGQIKFLADAGAITKKMAADLLKDGDYVPFYRVDADGQAELIFNDNVQIRVGNIKDQPYLHALKGGETKILPISESIPQNTLLLTDKALTNLTGRSIAYAFQEIGNVRPDGGKNEMVIHTGHAPADKNVLRFHQEPDPKNPQDKGDRWIRIDTTGTLMDGVPDSMVMKSIEGTALTLPAYLEFGAMASDLLRSGVTRTPLYIAHQLLRDPMSASATAGIGKNPFMAVLSAGKHFIQMQRGTSKTGAELISRGIIQSGIFKGDKSDITKFALQLASGKDQTAIEKLVAMADRAALNADAATRAMVWDSARKQGLSEVEAELMTRESMNFQKRGLSATVQHTNRMVPFLNSQIQALNVYAKAVRGNMPFEKQLNIKKKFYNTALTLGGAGLAYGFAMSGNPYYENAKLEDRYNNMFVFLPGVDEPVKIPIPYEVGYFFSLGVAAADGIKGEVKSSQQLKALAKVFSNSIPGYSSDFVPQIVKPVAEVALNHDFYTGKEIVPKRLQGIDPAEQYTANTTEMAKQLGSITGISPMMLEHVVRGYLGQLPLAAAAGANEIISSGTGKSVQRASDLPLVGSAFQKKFGGGDAELAYGMANDAIQAKTTFNKIKGEGRGEDARNYLKENKASIAMATAATQYKQKMAKLAADTRAIQGRHNLSDEEKRARLDRLDEIRQQEAHQYLTAFRRIQERK